MQSFWAIVLLSSARPEFKEIIGSLLALADVVILRGNSSPGDPTIQPSGLFYALLSIRSLYRRVIPVPGPNLLGSKLYRVEELHNHFKGWDAPFNRFWGLLPRSLLRGSSFLC